MRLVVQIHVAAAILHLGKGFVSGIGHVFVFVVLTLFDIMVWKDVDAAIFHDHASSLALLDAAAENEDSQAVENLALDETGQGTSTISGRVPGSAKVILDLGGALDEDIAAVLLESLLNLGKPEVDDLANLSLSETVEDHRTGNPVQELGQEVVAKGTHDQLTGLRVNLTVLGCRACQVLGTQVGGHDDDAVPRVDNAALAVGDTAVVHQLQEDSEHLLGSLLDLVEQENGEGAAAQTFR